MRSAYKAHAPSIAIGEWTVDDVKAAVAQHELGNFHKSSLLIDGMGRDDRIASALETLVLGVLRLPRKVEPRLTSALALAAADTFRENFRRFATSPVLFDALVWLVFAGFALVEVVWNTTDTSHWTVERLVVWHLQHVYWREDLKRIVALTVDGPVEIDPEDPGPQWRFVRAAGSRPWMRGAVRSIGDDFVSHAETWMDWRRASEVHGAGIMKAIVPVGLADTGEKDAFVDSVANLGGEPVVECPRDEQGKGYDLEHMSTGRDHAPGFKMLIDAIVASINVRILGQNASSENAGPYVAKGGLFAKVTLDRIDGVVDPLEDALNGIAEHFALFNYGDALLAPFVEYDSEPPPDKRAQADTMQVVGTAAAAFKTAGLEVDPAEIFARFGFTLTRAEAAPTEVAP